ncbi:unnamed protein product [Leptidea sinapis]|uniref:Uncharacterized protein n=1 Tax=Leptidea sinapis TaxID=189913 RepID=A0A5E4QED2_9NEOP|nr:unnamed protein product [Leptidea sinapis]
MENMEKKIEYLENLKRKNNLIFFGVSEIGPDMSETENIKTIIENKTIDNKIDIHKYDINNVYRLICEKEKRETYSPIIGKLYNGVENKFNTKKQTGIRFKDMHKRGFFKRNTQ